MQTLILAGVSLVFAVAAVAAPPVTAAESRVEAQFQQLLEVLKGKRVGLLTVPTSVDGEFNLLADRLHAHPDVKLVCFFAAEHGLRGDRQAGAKVDDYTDEATGLPVFSVYGSRKAPEPDHCALFDVLMCDMQDVGVRFYTRIWTVTAAMEAVAKAGKEIVIFDRPNPIGLSRMEGAPTTLDAGLIGPRWPGQPSGIPTRHGMTMGEIVSLVNAEWAKPRARLTVIKVPGYTRGMSFEETGYPWVLPSPNMPTIDAAIVYPGTCIFEGSNVSEGRGTTRPFELIGAPFVDAARLARVLNEAGLKGVRFREAWFTPTFDDFAGQLCGGVQLHVTDVDAFDPIRTGLTMLKTLCELYPEQVKVTAMASRLMGVPNLHEKIRTQSVDALIAAWQDDLKGFDALRQPYLLYPSR